MTPQQLLEKMVDAMQEHAGDGDGVIIFVVGEERPDGRVTIHGGSNLDMSSIEKVVRLWLETPENVS